MKTSIGALLGAVFLTGLFTGTALSSADDSPSTETTPTAPSAPATAPEQPHKATKNPLAQEHPIVIDATALRPPISWSIPGVTEPVQSLNALMSDKVKTINLKPGRYNYLTTSFSFLFTVSLKGELDFLPMHDQCIAGRGTATLTIKCRRMNPF